MEITSQQVEHPNRKSRKEYMESFINRMGDMEKFIQYNREHALKSYFKRSYNISTIQNLSQRKEVDEE